MVLWQDTMRGENKVASGSGAQGTEARVAPDGFYPGSVTIRVPKVGYVYDQRMMGHAPTQDPDDPDDDDDHPEKPVRIQYIDTRLSQTGCLAQMDKIAIRSMRKDEALLVHSEDHWQKVAAIECGCAL